MGRNTSHTKHLAHEQKFISNDFNLSRIFLVLFVAFVSAVLFGIVGYFLGIEQQIDINISINSYRVTRPPNVPSIPIPIVDTHATAK